MISIVCVFNDRKILENYLLASLKNQTAEFELILLDNTEGRFRSAAEALNYGGSQAKGEYIMFVHQDVKIMSPTWLEDCEKLLSELPALGVAGVAGRREDSPEVLSNVSHGTTPRPAGIRIDKPVEVQTVDPCLFIVPRNVFERLKFDEVTCDDWHLYAEDFLPDSEKIIEVEHLCSTSSDISPVHWG
ncbi:MAG: glycosyltransferase [Candidatus Korarchaeum sp.]